MKDLEPEEEPTREELERIEKMIDKNIFVDIDELFLDDLTNPYWDDLDNFSFNEY